MKKLSTLTYEFAEGCLSKNNKIEAKLFLNWNKIFKHYNHIIKPVKIYFSKKKLREGVLFLRVKRGFELEIQMEHIKILNLANDFIGYKAVHKIKILN